MAENLTPVDDGDGEPLPYEPGANPRYAVEDALAAKRSKEHESLPTLDGLNAQNAGDKPEEDDQQPTEAGSDDTDPPRDEAGRFASRDPKPQDDDGSSGDTRKFKLNVYGQELELTEAEVIERAQKAEAAERRFMEAAAIKRQAEELVRQYQSQSQKQPEQPSTPENGDDPLVRALMYGDEAEVRNALAELRKPQQSVDPQQIVAQTAQVLAEQNEYQTALNSALNEFPEVKADQRLQEVATSFVMESLFEDLQRIGYTEQELKSVPPNKWWDVRRRAKQAGFGVASYHDLFMSAGTRTRTWRSGGQQPTDGLAEKAARKASAPSQPRAAHAATPARGEPRPKTQSEIIAEDRKARGLPNY